MKTSFIFLLIILASFLKISAEEPYPVRGFCIAAPSVDIVDEFVSFIDKELAPAGVNTLVLLVGYGYRYESHPELVGKNPLEKDDIKKLVAVCKKNNIKLIPQINLLGHQSWQSTPGKLLEVYPEFDETPDIKLPEPGEYKFPNPDGLYCKSYCPLHPEVHKVIFDVVDEICDVFETDIFHAGMDEVFYIGHEQCRRCYGHDKAELFAGEVTKIRDHLAKSGVELWIWGDRLIDGKTTGAGLWEGSFNNTHRAIDLIPKDVVICDWHYHRPVPTAVLFAAKGFRVITCPFNKPDVAVRQDKMTREFISGSPGEMKPRFAGMMQTAWRSAKLFIDTYKGNAPEDKKDPSVECFKALAGIWRD